MSLDNTLWFAGFVTEAAVAGLLLYRRVWRSLPCFSVFIVWTLLSDVSAFAIFRSFPAASLTAYLTQTIIDSVLQFAVLVELAWSVLRPIRASLPRGALFAVGGLVLAVSGIVWMFAAIPGFNNLPREWHVLMRVQQTDSILRVLVFVGLAACSQLLSIGWRDRELQVATGLGFYSLVGLAVAMLHTHPMMQTHYRQLDQMLVGSYLCSLLYWVVSFVQKEAPRQEFSPKMESFLLSLAGVAHANRVALVDRPAGKIEERTKR